MFIELTEVLRCPKDHDEAYVVCVPIEMRERDVVRGVIGCPICQAEFPIVGGVAHFEATAHSSAFTDESTGAPPDYDAAALAAFLALEGRGGYVLLAGRAARHAAALAANLSGIHVVAVNPPAGVAPAAMVSVLRAIDVLPLKAMHVRGVALGADHATAAWVAEAERVLLPGLRLVIEGEAVEPARSDVLARGGGVLVAERRAH